MIERTAANTPLLNDLRDTEYPKHWLAHLIADQMSTAPMPTNPVDQGELFQYIKETENASTSEIAKRFKIYQQQRDGTTVAVFWIQYVHNCLCLSNPRINPNDRKKVREGKKTAAWLAKKLNNLLHCGIVDEISGQIPSMP